MTTEITMPAKDAKRLDAMLEAIKKKPDSASQFLTYAYGLGFCEGRQVTAKQILAEIEKAPSPFAAPMPSQEKP